MEEQAREMMSHWIEPKHLYISHVGKPGNRMPVAGLTAAKGPGNVGPTQPAEHVRIARDVIGVVVPNEPISQHGPESGKRETTYERPDENSLPTLGAEMWLRRLHAKHGTVRSLLAGPGPAPDTGH